jgi:SHS2 domain-containing protein
MRGEERRFLTLACKVERSVTKPAEGSAAEPFALGPEIGVCGIGPTRQAAFEPAAFALGCAITDPARIGLQEAIEVTCEARDDTYPPVDLVCHMPAVEPKGATLTSLKVAIRDDGAWVAQFVVGTPSAIVVGLARAGQSMHLPRRATAPAGV